MKVAVFAAVFVAGAHVGALVALFAAHRLDGPRIRFGTVRAAGRAAAPSRAVPAAEPIVPTALLASLPKPLVVSDVQVLPGSSGWGRPSWPNLNIQFAQPLGYDDSDDDVVPDGDREVDGGDDERPYELRGDANQAVWRPASLSANAGSLFRRLTRAFRGNEHEGWEHGHMHELRGSHRGDGVAEPSPGHRPAHSSDGDTRRLPVESVQRALRGAA